MQSERTGLGGNIVSEERLEAVLAEHLEELGIQEPWSVAQDLVKKLHERNFMLSSLGDGQYAFVHRTFLESFCAREYAYRFQSTKDLTIDGLKQLFGVHWESDEWREVLRLICALIGAEYTREVIDPLLEQKGQNDERPGVFFAAECLGEIQEIGLVHDLRNRVRGQLLQVFELSTGGEGRTKEFFEAGRLLAKSWKDDPEVRRMVERSATQDPNPTARVMAGFVLGRNWRDEPDVRQLFTEWATQDAHAVVRAQVVAMLALNWGDHPEIRQLVKQRATQDPDSVARAMALLTLASDWSDDTEVRQMVTERAAQDPDPLPRAMALDALASNRSDDPEVKQLVTERATQDPDPAVRVQALEVLASKWSEDPEVKRLVQERVTQDPDPAVRGQTLQVLASKWSEDPEVKRLVQERAAEEQSSVSGEEPIG